MRKRATTTTVPSRWRKRGLAVEAMQWDGTPDQLREITLWSEGRVQYDQAAGMPVVATPEGRSPILNKGDWVIRGVLGEFYPVSAMVHEATYDAADDDDHRAVLTSEQLRGMLEAAARTADPTQLREYLGVVAASHEALRLPNPMP